MPKITKRAVDAIRPPQSRADGRARQEWLWDAEIKGFGICVRSTGIHSYVYNYRDPHGRQRNFTIGKVGSMTPDEARKRAEKLRRDVADGRSPLAERRAAKTAMSVGELLDKYLASERFKRKSPTTQVVDRGRIERHLRPVLGRHILEALTRDDIEAAHSKIVAGKTATDVKTGVRGRAIVKGGEGTARMAIRLFRAILNWASGRGILPAGASPDLVTGIEIGRDGKRGLILDDPEAYARLWQVLDRLTNPGALTGDDKLIRREVADAIRVIALTGARKSEITGLRWSHVDLKAGTLTLPLDAHKTGRKTGEERVIGLPALASAIIARQLAGEPGDLVFRPARGSSGPLDLTKPWRIVREVAELPAGIGLHGLRHSLASHMAMNGAEAAEIMAALGHRDITTSQKYVHWARDKRQALAERAAAGITAAVMGTAQTPTKVASMAGRG